jgi:hypothetical protein
MTAVSTLTAAQNGTYACARNPQASSASGSTLRAEPGEPLPPMTSKAPRKKTLKCSDDNSDRSN